MYNTIDWKIQKEEIEKHYRYILQQVCSIEMELSTLKTIPFL